MVATLNFDQLSGAEKAAVFVLAVSEEQATKLFASLEIEEVKEISQTMSTLGRVDSDTVEKLFQDFASQLSRTGGVLGSFETTQRLLSRIMDNEKVGDIMEEIRGPAGRTIWDKLGNVNESVLGSYLQKEYPQTVSVILSRIDPDHAARVLAVMPDDFAMEVIVRMLRMETVQRGVLTDVEKTLRAEFMNNLARSNRRDNHEVMAEIFNFFDRSTESKFLKLLEERSEDSAERIKSLMFTFEDLVKVNAAGIQTLIRNAGNERVGLALKGASEPLKELFFANMSERAGNILKDEMESLGPVRVRDVDEAQLFLVNMAKELAASGEIDLKDNDEEELVY
ncbi:MAG: flagellar motor switch protein FliG [Pseudomonadota bacterium]